MKKQKQILNSFLGILVFSFIIISFISCTEDSITGNNQTPPVFGGYEENEAAVNMTLAALCYTAENNPNVQVIKDSLILQLNEPAYSTQAKWELAWGPGISPGRGNMMYVAVDSTSDTIYYAIAIRGTDWEFPTNIQQDIEVWKLIKYPYGGTDDSVAIGSLSGLDTLLNSTFDPVSGETLQMFLNNIPNGQLKMYITGHSLGGALATLMTAWFIDNGFTPKFTLETYTFAAPTVGNTSFANRFQTIMLSANAQSHRVVNSKDLVPYGWAGIGNVVTERIPTNVPLLFGILFDAIQLSLDSLNIYYKHVETKQSIGFITPTNCSGGSELENYLCWVGFEHSHNNYLRLLNADTVKLNKTW